MLLELAVQDEERQPRPLMYVAVRMGNGIGSDVTVTTEDVTGTVDDLKAGLRPWLLALLRDGSHDHGWYVGCLVGVDDDGAYDTYWSLAMEDVLWFWESECVPLSQLSSAP
jgi:hypothetical protein